MKNTKVERTVLAGSFLRNFFVSCATIYANALFIQKVGGASWPLLFFWVQVTSVSLLVSFTVLSKKQTGASYFTLLVATLAFLLLQHRYPDYLPFLYALGAFTLACDIVGNIVANSLLPDLFGPHRIREIGQKMIPYDLAGRLAGVALIEAVHIVPLPNLFSLSLAVIISAHGILYFINYRQAITAQAAPGESPGPIERAQSSLSDGFLGIGRFFMENRFFRITFYLMAWTQLAKFFVQALYIRGVEDLSFNKEDSSLLMSRVFLLTIGLTYVFQLVVGKQAVRGARLSVLFALMPATLLVIGSLALLTNYPWLLVANMTAFLMINKVIQAPVNRQCLFVLPKSKVHGSQFLVSAAISVLMMIVSASVGKFAKSWPDEVLNMALIALCLGVFFILTRLDNYYVDTLWRNLKEDLKQLTAKITQTAAIADDSCTIWTKYQKANSPEECSEAVAHHRSQITSERGQGILRFLSFPGFQKFLRQTPEEVELTKVLESLAAAQINIDTRQKLKKELCLDWKHFAQFQSELITLLETENNEIADCFFRELLDSPRCDHQQFFGYINSDGLDFTKILREFSEVDSARSWKIGKLLRSLGKTSFPEKSVLSFIEKIKMQLGAEGARYINGTAEQRDMIRRGLFLIEWNYLSADRSHGLLESLMNFDAFSKSETEMWIFLHSEVLREKREFGFNAFLR